MIKVGILKDEDEKDRVRKYLQGLLRRELRKPVGQPMRSPGEIIGLIELHLCGEEIPR